MKTFARKWLVPIVLWLGVWASIGEPMPWPRALMLITCVACIRMHDRYEMERES